MMQILDISVKGILGAVDDGLEERKNWQKEINDALLEINDGAQEINDALREINDGVRKINVYL
jgi:uncharacterized phage infection (PIP) family protein YhgE